MSDLKYGFQYCQKLVVFNADFSEVFLAKRRGEADYDGAWSFIGGKMETSDLSIVAGLKREKDEEVGANFKLKIYTDASHNLLFRKKDGSSMILPHYLAIHQSGEPKLNKQEYSEAGWFGIDELAKLEPKIETIPGIVAWALDLLKRAEDNFVKI